MFVASIINGQNTRKKETHVLSSAQYSFSNTYSAGVYVRRRQ